MGELAKMEIIAFKTDDFKEPAIGTFKFQINPENYSEKFESSNDYDANLANGQRVRLVEPVTDPDLDISFYLDNTGVIPDSKDVSAEIKKLKSLCAQVNGDIHVPNYLKVIWGKNFTFPCKLKSLKIDYLLFKSDGSPLRAKIAASFKYFENAETRAKKRKLSSPDLTHQRTIKAGDSLPAMCQDIYGDTKYCIQVAQVNNLVNFRRLTPGQRIIFPKLER